MRLRNVFATALLYLASSLATCGGVFNELRVESERSFRVDVQTFLSKVECVNKTGEGWLVKCPAHDDKHNSLSVGVGDDRRILLTCFAGCSTEVIAAALGLQMRDLFPDSNASTGNVFKGKGGASAPRKGFEHPNTSSKGLNLEQYANAKHLSLDFLRELGISQFLYLGQPALRIPYYDIDGSEVSVRFRLEITKSEQADNRFRWKKGSKLCLYGLWRAEKADQAGYVILVEGESDCHTLWHHGFHAFGIPGANIWKEERDAKHFDGIKTIYVVIEPDHGGQAVLDWVAVSSIRDRVRTINLGEYKDPSDLYLANPETFKEAWQAALNAAVPWNVKVRDEQASKAENAYALARPLLDHPRLLDQIGETMRAQGYAGDLNAPLLAYIAVTSRLLERPLNLAFVAPSSAGKNRAIDAALNLIPQEAIYFERAGSARALIYTYESFEHRTVVIAEADSIPEEGPAASAVRSLAADNCMAYDVVEKNPQTGRFETRHIMKPGPTGFITTSTRSLGHQMNTRVLEIPLQDDPNQTRDIMRAHARNVSALAKSTPDIGPWLALQVWLAIRGTHQVTIPFAETLANLIPSKNVRMRRDFRQLLTCIQAIALLYQCQRSITSEEQVQATIADYEMARRLLAPIFETLASEGVTPAIRETIEAIKVDEEVTETELAQRLKLAKSTVSYRVNRAIKGGWLVNNEIRRGHPAKLVRGIPLPETATALPDPELLREVFESSNRSGQENVSPPPSPGIQADDVMGSDGRDLEYV